MSRILHEVELFDPSLPFFLRQPRYDLAIAFSTGIYKPFRLDGREKSNPVRRFELQRPPQSMGAEIYICRTSDSTPFVQEPATTPPMNAVDQRVERYRLRCKTHPKIIRIQASSVAIDHPGHVLIETLPTCYFFARYRRPLEFYDHSVRRFHIGDVIFTSLLVEMNGLSQSSGNNAFHLRCHSDSEPHQGSQLLPGIRAQCHTTNWPHLATISSSQYWQIPRLPLEGFDRWPSTIANYMRCSNCQNECVLRGPTGTANRS